MRQIVHDLRKQSADVRHRTTMLIAVVISALILIIWMGTFRLQPTSTVQSVKREMAPFALVKDNIVQVFGTAQKGLESAQRSVIPGDSN